MPKLHKKHPSFRFAATKPAAQGPSFDAKQLKNARSILLFNPTDNMPLPAAPTVSVIIPAYNAAQLIRPTVLSALSQTHPQTEVIVVDDGSRDDTAALAESFAGVKCIRQVNMGVSAARNTGAAAATGQYLAFLDADDVWHPAKLALQVKDMEAHQGIALSRTHFRESQWTQHEFDSCFESPVSQIVEHLSESFLNPYFATSTVMVRRSAFESVGGFDTELRIAEDVDFYLRILASDHRVLVLPQPVVFKRPVKGSLGDNSEAGYVQLLRVYDRYLDQHPALRNELGQTTIDLVYRSLHLAHSRSLMWNSSGPASRQAMARARQFGWDNEMAEIWLRTWVPQALKRRLSALKHLLSRSNAG
jgi:glycosyltransferase involved in cell wall biosynthesis